MVKAEFKFLKMILFLHNFIWNIYAILGGCIPLKYYKILFDVRWIHGKLNLKYEREFEVTLNLKHMQK